MSVATPARRWPGELLTLEGDGSVRVERRPAAADGALPQRETAAVEGMPELAVAVECEQGRGRQRGQRERGSPPDAQRNGDHQSGEGNRERADEAARPRRAWMRDERGGRVGRAGVDGAKERRELARADHRREQRPAAAPPHCRLRSP